MRIEMRVFVRFIIALVCFSVDFSAAADFFRVEERGGKWRLLDPDGKPFYLRGLNHYGDGTYMPWNVEARYGNVESWRRELPQRVRAWGFNYLPPSIGPSRIDPTRMTREWVEANRSRNNRGLVTRTSEWDASDFAELDFPFTIFLEYPRQYMAGRNLPDVFSDAFKDAVDARCRDVCLPLRENRNLIGYHFCHNPPWHSRMPSFDYWIEDIVKPGTAAMGEWIQLMRRIYGTTDRWRETYGYPIQSWEEIGSLERPLRGYVSHGRMLADKEAFMQRICEQWYSVYSRAVRNYDTNHLIFGDRNTLHLQPLPAYAIQIMSKYVDVLSVNVMGPPRMVYPVLEQATRHWDGPIHLADTGAGVYTGEPAKAAFTSGDLAEFESVYAGMMKMGVEHPQIIGFGWCGYYETPHPGGRSGLVDCRNDEPLPERIRIVRKWNAWMEEQVMADGP